MHFSLVIFQLLYARKSDGTPVTLPLNGAGSLEARIVNTRYTVGLCLVVVVNWPVIVSCEWHTINVIGSNDISALM